VEVDAAGGCITLPATSLRPVSANTVSVKKILWKSRNRNLLLVIIWKRRFIRKKKTACWQQP